MSSIPKELPESNAQSPSPSSQSFGQSLTCDDFGFDFNVDFNVRHTRKGRERESDADERTCVAHMFRDGDEKS